MPDNRLVNTPMEDSRMLKGEIVENSKKDCKQGQFPYGDAIGSLLYFVIGTHPDPGVSFGKPAKFCKSPKVTH